MLSVIFCCLLLLLGWRVWLLRFVHAWKMWNRWKFGERLGMRLYHCYCCQWFGRFCVLILCVHICVLTTLGSSLVISSLVVSNSLPTEVCLQWRVYDSAATTASVGRREIEVAAVSEKINHKYIYNIEKNKQPMKRQNRAKATRKML